MRSGTAACSSTPPPSSWRSPSSGTSPSSTRSSIALSRARRRAAAGTQKGGDRTAAGMSRLPLCRARDLGRNSPPPRVPGPRGASGKGIGGLAGCAPVGTGRHLPDHTVGPEANEVLERFALGPPGGRGSRRAARHSLTAAICVAARLALLSRGADTVQLAHRRLEDADIETPILRRAGLNVPDTGPDQVITSAHRCRTAIAGNAGDSVSAPPRSTIHSMIPPCKNTNTTQVHPRDSKGFAAASVGQNIPLFAINRDRERPRAVRAQQCGTG